jgi:sulfur-oxidizing protein SoxY
MTVSRRAALALALGAPLTLAIRPASATPEEMEAAIDEFTGGANLQEGRVTLDIPQLSENGNSVPMTVSVDSPMTEADHVEEIAVFNARNPLPDIVRFRPTPAMGEARLSTRIRLGETQTIRAVARMNDGSHWTGSISVIVTAPACLES